MTNTALSQVVTDIEQNPAAREEEEISLLDLVVIVVRRKRLIVAVTAAFLVLGLLLCFLLPIRYTANSTILPPQQNSSAGAGMLAQLGNLGAMASLSGGGILKNPNDLQVAILKSRTVEDAMVDRFHLMALYHAKYQSEARKKFEDRAKIESGTKDGLIHISVTDTNASRAAEITNGYVDEYRKFSATLAVTEAAQRRLFFEQQLIQAKDNLATSEEVLKATEQRTGLVQLDSQTRAVIESVASLRAQIATKEVQIQAMQSYATGENPDLHLAEQELVGLKAQLDKMGVSSGGQSGDLLMPKGSVPQAGLSYVRALRDVKYYETIFDLLARQFEAAKLDEARQGAVVQVVDKAVVPDRKSFPKRTFIMIGALLAGVLIGAILAFVFEGMERVMRKPEQRARIELIKRYWSSKDSIKPHN